MNLPRSQDVAVKVELHSMVPVVVAFAPLEWEKGFLEDGRLFAANLQNPAIRCAEAKVLQTTVECVFPAGTGPQVFVIQDMRSSDPGFLASLTAAGLAYMGAHDPLKEMTTRNDVSVAVYDYECVENCE